MYPSKHNIEQLVTPYQEYTLSEATGYLPHYSHTPLGKYCTTMEAYMGR